MPFVMHCLNPIIHYRPLILSRGLYGGWKEVLRNLFALRASLGCMRVSFGRSPYRSHQKVSTRKYYFGLRLGCSQARISLLTRFASWSYRWLQQRIGGNRGKKSEAERELQDVINPTGLSQKRLLC